MASQEFLTKAYLAYFGRPVDVTGQAYWATKTEAEVIAGFSASNESRALYGDEFNVHQINAIYNNLFNRDAEPAGLTYWLQEVFSGRVAPLEAALAILNGAANEDKTAVENKLAASQMFTEGLDTTSEMLGYNGPDAAAAARNFLSTVTTTVPTQDVVDQAIATVTTGGGAPGSTLTLTTGLDNIVGTANNDTIVGLVDGAGNTLTLGDIINGGAGVDTLKLTVGTDAVNLGIANITNVENLVADIRDDSFDTLNVANNAFAKVTLDFNGMLHDDSVDVVNINKASAVQIQNVALDGFWIDLDYAGAGFINNSLTLANVSDGDVYADFNHAGDAAGGTFTLNLNGADDMYVSLDNGGAAQVLNVVVGADSAGIEVENYWNFDDEDATVNLVLNADLEGSSWDLADTTGTLTVNISGSGNLTIDGLDDDSGTGLVVNGAAATGNLDIDFDGRGDIQSVVTGSGDDRVALDASYFAAGSEFSLDMGQGANTLRVDGVADDTDVAALVFTDDDLSVAGVSTLSLTDALTLGANATLDFDGLAPAGVVFEGAVGLAGKALALANTAAALDLTFKGALDSAAAASVLDLGDAADTVTITAEAAVGATNKVTVAGEALAALTVNAGASAKFDVGATEEALQTIAINASGDASTITSTISGDATEGFSLASLTLTDTSEAGDVEFEITLVDTVGLTSINLSGGEATLFTIDASKAQFAGAVTINIGDFGVDADGVPAAAGGLDYTADTTGTLREVFKFVGENIGNIGIDDFMAGVGGNADRLDFSAFDGVSGLDDLNLSLSGGNTVITSDAFDGTITVLGVDLTTDAFNFIF